MALVSRDNVIDKPPEPGRVPVLTEMHGAREVGQLRQYFVGPQHVWTIIGALVHRGVSDFVCNVVLDAVALSGDTLPDVILGRAPPLTAM